MLSDRIVPFDEVTLDTRLRMRALDPEHVQLFIDLYAQGDTVPDPVAFEVDGALYLTDGFARFEAQRTLTPNGGISVIVRHGSWVDAVEHAATANAKRGRSLSEGDGSLGRAIWTLWNIRGRPTERGGQERVRKDLGCSQAFVSRVLSGERCPEVFAAFNPGTMPGHVMEERAPKPSPKREAATAAWQQTPTATAEQVAKAAGVSVPTAERAKPETLKRATVTGPETRPALRLVPPVAEPHDAVAWEATIENMPERMNILSYFTDEEFRAVATEAQAAALQSWDVAARELVRELAFRRAAAAVEVWPVVRRLAEDLGEGKRQPLNRKPKDVADETWRLAILLGMGLDEDDWASLTARMGDLTARTEAVGGE